MPSNRAIAASVAVALLITASGCGALQGGTGGGPTANQTGSSGDAVVRQTVSSLQSVESYSYDSTVSTQSNRSSSTLNVTGTVDSADRRLRFQQSTSSQSAIQYVIEDTIYLQSNGSWITRSLGTSSFWTEQTPVAEQRVILANSSATLVGNATVDGTDVYELSVNVSDDQLLGFLRQRLGAVSPKVAIDDVQYTVFVTHGDYRLERVTADMTVSFQGKSVHVSTLTNFDNYGEEVSIELPADAKQDG